MRQQLRILIGALLIIGAALSVEYLQGRFDRSDERGAVGVVRDYRPPGEQTTVDRLLASRHGIRPGDLRWSGALTSGCFGYVRVTCEVPSNPPVVYRFDVDINRNAIHPGNDRASRFLAPHHPPGGRT